MKAETRCFMYSKEFPKGVIFEKDEEIPDGFFDSPAKLKAPKKKRGRPRKNERE